MGTISKIDEKSSLLISPKNKQKTDKEILMDSLNFKNFLSYVPLVPKGEMISGTIFFKLFELKNNYKQKKNR